MARVLTIIMVLAMAGTAQIFKPGDKVPHFKLRTLDNKEKIDSKDLKGSFIVYDFWYSFAPASEWFLPALQKMQTEKPDIQVVTINQDLKPAAGLRFLQKHKAERLLSLYDGRKEVGEMFRVKMLPSVIIANSKGVVVFAKYSYQKEDVKELKEKVRQVLGLEEAQASRE